MLQTANTSGYKLLTHRPSVTLIGGCEFFSCWHPQSHLVLHGVLVWVPLHITPGTSGSMWATVGDAGLVPSVVQVARVPRWTLLGIPCAAGLEIICPGLGRGKGRLGGPRKDEGVGRRVDRPPTSFPRCCAERLSLRVYTFPQTEISRQTPGAESSEKPPAGCITRTPLVVKPSIRPSGVRHLAARSWDHTWDQITSPSGPQQAASQECCPSTLELRGGPERTRIGAA